MKRYWPTGLVLIGMVVSLSACGSMTADSAPSPTSTQIVITDYAPNPGLAGLLKDSQAVAIVEPVSFRYEVYQAPTVVNSDPDPLKNPMAGMPDPVYRYTPPPDPLTIVTAKVVEGLMGGLQSGQMIDISHYGGILNGKLYLEDGVPQLSDHIGQNIVIALVHDDSWESNSYSTSSALYGMWLYDNTSGEATLLSETDLNSAKSDDATLTINDFRKTISEII